MRLGYAHPDPFCEIDGDERRDVGYREAVPRDKGAVAEARVKRVEEVLGQNPPALGERRAVDRPADSADFQERSIEAREYAEAPVVHKEARVVEEIGLNKDVESHVETVRDTVRKTEVEIEDERIARVSNYYNLQDWIAQVGA